MADQPALNLSYSRNIDAEFSRWAEQFNEELLYFEHDLRGEYLDTKDNTPNWKVGGDRLLNEKGIRYLIGDLRSIANKNTYLSNIEESDRYRIYDIIVSSLNTITDNLLFNHQEYALEARNLDSIVEKCANIIEFSVRRPLLAGERRFLKDTHTSSESVVRNEAPSGSNPIGGLMTIFRGGKK